MATPASPVDVSPSLFDDSGFLPSDQPIDARPARPLPLPAEDGRHFATKAIAKYIASWTFNVRSVGRTTKPLKLDPEKQILFEWPSDPKELKMPCLIFEPEGDPEQDFIGNVPYIEPGTEDVFAPGTAVYEWAEHVEDLRLHVFAPDKPTRRALIAGLMNVFNPIQNMLGFRLVLKDYFNHTVRVTMNSGGRKEDEDAVRNRRKAEFLITIEFNLGMLANAEDFVPTVEVDVLTASEEAAAEAKASGQ